MKHIFNAGPAVLPKPVLKELSEALIDLNGSGISVAEISHRSKSFIEIMEESQSLVREILGLSKKFEVLFLSGGASSQFYMTAMNLLSPGEQAGYIDTGSWSRKAINEAKLYGNIKVIASSRDKNYSYIPKNYEIEKELKYIHFTSNNTIFGTQFHQMPETDLFLVSDMSSDIMSTAIDAERFGIIYAGAQKNIGPAGTTLVVINSDFYSGHKNPLPSMCNYQLHIQKNSIYNTPPVISIYGCMLTLRWLKGIGGIKEIQKQNELKSALLYAEIDRNGMFHCPVEKEDRSHMNVCFLMNDPKQEDLFLNCCIDADIVGIKGHRSVGGFRASIYNALSLKSVKHLIEVLQYFEKEYA